MAELNTGGDKGKGGKKRSKKLSTKVDLTPMVDLAFLLITFFMLTTTLSKPQSMDLAMPDKPDENEPEETTKVDENRTLTILLGEDDHIEWYMGLVDEPKEGPIETSYGKDGIRNIIIDKKKDALAYSQDPKKGLIVILKPSPDSEYKNLVDILDEMAINKVESYAIGEISDQELEILGEIPTDSIGTPEKKSDTNN